MPAGLAPTPLWSPGGVRLAAGSGGGGGSRALILSPSALHIIALPLLLVGALCVGFLLVFLKEVLLPFVIAVFVVYLLRPLVDLICTPFSEWAMLMPPFCCPPALARGVTALTAAAARLGGGGGGGGYSRLGPQVGPPAPSALGEASGELEAGSAGLAALGAAAAGGPTISGGAGAAAAGGASMAAGGGAGGVGGGGASSLSNGPLGPRRHRSASPGKWPRTARGVAARVTSAVTDAVSSLAMHSAALLGGGAGGPGAGSAPGGPAAGAPTVPVVGGATLSLPHATMGPSGGLSGNGGAATGSDGDRLHGHHHHGNGGAGAHAHPHRPHHHHHHHHHQARGSHCRMTRCPRWFAILVAIAAAGSLLAGLVVLLADAIKRFQEDALGVYVDPAKNAAEKVQKWFEALDIKLDANQILEVLKKEFLTLELVKLTLTALVNGLGNVLLIFLLVLYLLAEQSNHAPDSLRARVDAQVGRYLTIKTSISVGQGAAIFVLLGPTVLNVRMAHVFAVIHGLFNFIPTAGPILATVLPLPVVVLDPALSLTSKIVAFAGPTAIHLLVGNLLEPLVFGSSMEMHPVTVLLALALWYALWGIPGAILAVPITAVLRIVLGSLDHAYASILIAGIEGRLTTATEQLDHALDTSGAEAAAAAAGDAHHDGAHGEGGADAEGGEGGGHSRGGSVFAGTLLDSARSAADGTPMLVRSGSGGGGSSKRMLLGLGASGSGAQQHENGAASSVDSALAPRLPAPRGALLPPASTPSGGVGGGSSSAGGGPFALSGERGGRGNGSGTGAPDAFAGGGRWPGGVGATLGAGRETAVSLPTQRATGNAWHASPAALEEASEEEGEGASGWASWGAGGRDGASSGGAVEGAGTGL